MEGRFRYRCARSVRAIEDQPPSPFQLLGFREPFTGHGRISQGQIESIQEPIEAYCISTVPRLGTTICTRRTTVLPRRGLTLSKQTRCRPLRLSSRRVFLSPTATDHSVLLIKSRHVRTDVRFFLS